jgi:hypothetical protein
MLLFVLFNVRGVIHAVLQSSQRSRCLCDDIVATCGSKHAAAAAATAAATATTTATPL